MIEKTYKIIFEDEEQKKAFERFMTASGYLKEL
jgi:hypothetical protein